MGVCSRFVFSKDLTGCTNTVTRKYKNTTFPYVYLQSSFTYSRIPSSYSALIFYVCCCYILTLILSPSSRY